MCSEPLGQRFGGVVDRLCIDLATPIGLCDRLNFSRLGVLRERRPLLLKHLVHSRLDESRVPGLVVAVPTAARSVHHDVFFVCGAPVGCELTAKRGSLDVVPINACIALAVSCG